MVKKLFWIILKWGISISLFSVFGIILAVFALALDDDVSQKNTYIKQETFLSDFLLGQTKEIQLNSAQLDSNIASILIETCSSKDDKQITLPILPSFAIEDESLYVFVISNISVFKKLRLVELAFEFKLDGTDKFILSGAKLGKAKFPKFVAEILFDKILKKYIILTSVNKAIIDKYKETFSTCQKSISDGKLKLKAL